MAKAFGISLRTVQRIWEAHRLQPHRLRTFKRSKYPAFAAKVEDIVGLYMNPPAHAVGVSIDEKSQIQALDRTQPGLPLKPYKCGTMPRDYKRNGTITLSAALGVLHGTVVGRCMQKHRHQEFIKFLNAVERAIPACKIVDAVLGNYATHKHPKVLEWPSDHPRWVFHFTPTSGSWLNAIEKFFSVLIRGAIRSGVFTSVADLEDTIRTYIRKQNADLKPFVRPKPAQTILAKFRRLPAPSERVSAPSTHCPVAEGQRILSLSRINSVWEFHLHVHIIGIGGSGASSLARIALNEGFEVSGCDINVGNRSVDVIKKQGVNVSQGHDVSHVDCADIVAASPAVTTGRIRIEEVEYARQQGKLVTWQQFLGERILRKGKRVACIGGTHGKTTTTALCGELMSAAGLDPTVMIGGHIEKWGGNARIGSSSIYLCEADEFNYNFITYRPKFLLLNNVEYEHPEYYKSEEEYFRAFSDFVTTMPDGGTLIVNLDDRGARDIQNRCRHFLTSHNIKVVTFSSSPLHAGADQLCEIVGIGTEGMSVKFSGLVKTGVIDTKLIGRHNASNITGAILLCHVLGNISERVITDVLSDFIGAARRLQLIYNNGKIRVFDDYGHHPTEIGATLRALRDHNPDTQIIAVIEPHMVSRINSFATQYAEAVKVADAVVFTKTYFGREQGLDEPNIMKVAELIGDSKAQVFHDFDKTVHAVLHLMHEHGVIVVFGAGNSPELTKSIVQSI